MVQLLDDGQFPCVLVDAELVECVAPDDGVVEEGVEITVCVSCLHFPNDRLACPINVLAHLNENYGLIKKGCGSGSSYGSGSKLKQNFRRQFLSKKILKSKFESNQIKNKGVFINFFFEK
jgi:hypothetical protein